jgi:hypothetical protein
LAYITFHVKAYGSTFLDLQETVLADDGGNVIPHEVHGGFFANVEPKYMVKLLRVYPEHRKWVESEDRDNTLCAVVRNNGKVTTRVYIEYMITDETGMLVNTVCMHASQIF